MKLLQSILFLVLSMSMSSISYAASKWYAGIGLGVADIDSGVSNASSGVSLDEDDSSINLFGGYRFLPSLAVEAHIAELGEFSVTGNNTGDTFDYKGTTYVSLSAGSTATGVTTSLGMSAVYRFLHDTMVSPFVKGGLHFWSIDINGLPDITEDDGFGGLAGLGVDINFNGGFILRADYNYYQTDESIAVFGINGLWKF